MSGVRGERMYGRLGVSRCALGLAVLMMWGNCARAEWEDWEKYRTAVKHPCLMIKAEDIARAKENARRYEWAKKYVERVMNSAEETVGRGDEKWAEEFI